MLIRDVFHWLTISELYQCPQNVTVKFIIVKIYAKVKALIMKLI